MRTRPDSAHREAVTRRLELLRAELSLPAAEPEPPEPAAATSPGAADGRWWEELTVIDLAPVEATHPVETPPALPVPGRHAARRSWLVERLPETLRGRVCLGPWQVAVVALLVAIALATTCWLVVRSDASVIPAAAPSTDAGSAAASPLVQLDSPPAPSASATPSVASTQTVTIDVSGKVRRPGVLVLPAGSRVVDALAAAGGAKPGVDLGSLNQARVLVDGEQIAVGATSPPVVVPGTPGATTPAAGVLVNLNTASAEELDTLPQVGPVTAQAILDYRAEHGGFAAVEELLDVTGIGEATLAKIAPHVTV
ncbi:helix-hairpin-helix domain-containing protein [Nocardioides sp.]|uniref:helix-hairpin-helix domain-containing protein n=1 Tax=Nocardioides sp. TaxID=35761 RepID=UPI0039E64E57